MMVKLVCLLLSVSLLEFGSAELYKASSRSPDYKPSLYSQPSSEVLSNTSPEDAQNQPSQIRHQNSDLELEFAIEIKPHFLGNRYEAEEHSQRPEKRSGLFPVSSWYQVAEAPAAQRNEKEVTVTRKSINLDLDRNPAIALTLTLRIEDVNQIWGYAEDKSTEKPEFNTSETHNVGNQYTPIPESGNVYSSQDGYKPNDTINPLNPTFLNINTDEDTLNFEDFLKNNPGNPKIIETGNGNSFQVGSPSVFKIHANNDKNLKQHETTEKSRASSQSEPEDKAVSSYGYKEFNDFLNQKMEENKREKYVTDTETNNHKSLKQLGTTDNSSASSQRKPEDKAFSSYGLKEFDDFLNQKMYENKREKYVTDTETNNDYNQLNVGTHDSNHNTGRYAHTEAYDIDERMAFP